MQGTVRSGNRNLESSGKIQRKSNIERDIVETEPWSSIEITGKQDNGSNPKQ